jgi:hypothetical protein
MYVCVCVCVYNIHTYILVAPADRRRTRSSFFSRKRNEHVARKGVFPPELDMRQRLETDDTPRQRLCCCVHQSVGPHRRPAVCMCIYRSKVLADLLYGCIYTGANCWTLPRTCWRSHSTLCSSHMRLIHLLHLCPHTAIYASSYCYRCVLMLLYMCPRSNICVLILL